MIGLMMLAAAICPHDWQPSPLAEEAGLNVLYTFDQTPRDGMNVSLIRAIWRAMHEAEGRTSYRLFDPTQPDREPTSLPPCEDDDDG